MSIGVTPPVRSKTAPDPTIWDSGCAYYSGQYGIGQACFIQYMAQNNGGGDWYLADVQTATFSSGYGPGVYSTGPELVYPNDGNQELQWSPSSTDSVGGCQSFNVGVSDFVSVGASFTLCPNEIIPLVGHYYFGAMWFGNPVDGTRGADAADVVHDPASAVDAPTIYLIWAVA